MTATFQYQATSDGALSVETKDFYVLQVPPGLDEDGQVIDSFLRKEYFGGWGQDTETSYIPMAQKFETEDDPELLQALQAYGGKILRIRKTEWYELIGEGFEE